jgi:hypothetical protein
MILVCLAPSIASAQTCLLNEDFTGAALPAGWDIGPAVERIDANGSWTGEFVPAWWVGTAAEANANGYFPVPDGPVDNRFVMANDDAPPCDCDLDSARLTSPTIDLTGADHAVLTFRYVLDGVFGGDSAWVELTVDGSSWMRVADLVPGAGWQQRSVDLAAADGAPAARLRFHWTDRGGWATGLAVDDVCVRGRAAHDLALELLTFGDLHTSPFNSTIIGLDPAEVPVSQAASPSLSVVVRNKGHLPLFDVHTTVLLALNGGPQGLWSSDTLALLASNSADTLIVGTDWVPPGPGTLAATATVGSGGSEDVPGDETGTVQRRLTGGGWADGDGAYAHRAGPTLGAVDAGGVGYMAGCRYELQAEDQVHGLGVRLDAGTEVGALVIGRLLNPDLQPFASTDTIRITEADVQAGLAWGWTFLPFDTPVQVDGGTDVLAMVEQVPDSGLMRIALGGEMRPGAAAVHEINSLEWSYPLRAPLVRMHLSPVAVTVVEPRTRYELIVQQVGAQLTIQAPWPIRTIRVLDATGRTVRVQGPDGAMAAVSLGGLAEGAYLLIVEGQDAQATARFVRTR